MKKHLLLLVVLCLPPLAILLLPELAHAADEDFVSKLVHEFYNKTSAWEPTLKRYALIVFRMVVEPDQRPRRNRQGTDPRRLLFGISVPDRNAARQTGAG